MNPDGAVPAQEAQGEGISLKPRGTDWAGSGMRRGPAGSNGRTDMPTTCWLPAANCAADLEPEDGEYRCPLTGEPVVPIKGVAE